jgi:tripartite-type tricarboxylate transporter receptor subunit TctC
VDLSCSSLATFSPHIKAGKLRGLAITSKARHPDFPDIPTTAELGYPYVNMRIWSGAFAPAGVPQSVLDVLIPAIEKTLKHPDVINRGTKAGFTMEYKGPEEFRKFIESEIKLVEKIVKDTNMTKK